MGPLEKAKALLDLATPLNTDCGRYCGAACCRGSKEDGMILFPGEAELYAGIPGFTLLDRDGEAILVCGGSCDRKLRPLACRIFPLVFRVTEDRAFIALDPLARPVCPLAGSNLSAFSPGFLAAAEGALSVLTADEDLRAFLLRRTEADSELFDHPLFRIRKG